MFHVLSELLLPGGYLNNTQTYASSGEFSDCGYHRSFFFLWRLFLAPSCGLFKLTTCWFRSKGFLMEIVRALSLCSSFSLGSSSTRPATTYLLSYLAPPLSSADCWELFGFPFCPVLWMLSPGRDPGQPQCSAQLFPFHWESLFRMCIGHCLKMFISYVLSSVFLVCFNGKSANTYQLLFHGRKQGFVFLNWILITLRG